MTHPHMTDVSDMSDDILRQTMTDTEAWFHLRGERSLGALGCRSCAALSGAECIALLQTELLRRSSAVLFPGLSILEEIGRDRKRWKE